MSDEKLQVPNVVTDQADFNKVLEKLNAIDEKIEFVNSEIAQNIGKKIGRDIGILYGAITGVVIILIYFQIAPML